MIDMTPVLQPILTVLGTVITGLLVIYIPRAIAAFEARTGIQLTDQQRAIVLGSVQTAVGAIETKLDQKVLSVAHVTVDNSVVREQAAAAIAAVPDAAAALGMTVDGVSRMIVGKTDTAAHGPDAPSVVPAIVKVVTEPQGVI
jgi:hypothetical protein